MKANNVYCGIKITSFMRGKYLAKLWLAKTFGSKEKRLVDPYTNEYDPNGILVDSIREIAAMDWAYSMKSLSGRPLYDKNFINDQIWYELASEEDIQSREQFEYANDQMLRYM